jgi:hypothetical protein
MNKESSKLYQNNFGNIILIDCSTNLIQYDNAYINVKKPRGSKCLICNGTGNIIPDSDESDLIDETLICENCSGSGLVEYETWDAIFEDNKVKYIIKEHDLDQHGTYYIQVTLEKDSSDELPVRIQSETIIVEVYKQFK